jgi:maleate cis-trans isomerase
VLETRKLSKSYGDVAALRELDGDDIDALVQVGTNLAAIELCAEAEQWFGKPVLAINAVTYWDALRRSGRLCEVRDLQRAVGKPDQARYLTRGRAFSTPSRR